MASVEGAEALRALLENEDMERLEDYLKRGRPLEHVDIQELTRRWVAVVATWIAAMAAGAEVDGTQHTERRDIGSEFKLRGIEPPAGDAGIDMNALRAAALAAMGDPVKRKRIADSFIVDHARLLGHPKQKH
jgi:hypothetical protein